MPSDFKKIQIQTVIWQDMPDYAVKKSIQSIIQAAQIFKKHNVSIVIEINIMLQKNAKNIVEKAIKDASCVSIDININVVENEMLKYKEFNSCVKAGDSDCILIVGTGVILEPSCIEKLFAELQNKDDVLEARQTPIDFPKGYDEKTGDTEYASDICMMFSRKTYEAVDGFDELFHSFYGDIDFCLRVRLKNIKIRHIPSAMVFRSAVIDSKGEYTFYDLEKHDTIKNCDLIFFVEKWEKSENVDILRKNIIEKCEDAKQLMAMINQPHVINEISLEHKTIANVSNQYFCKKRF